MDIKVFNYPEEDVRVVLRENRMYVERMDGYDALGKETWYKIAELVIDKLEPYLYGDYGKAEHTTYLIGLLLKILHANMSAPPAAEVIPEQLELADEKTDEESDVN